MFLRSTNRKMLAIIEKRTNLDALPTGVYSGRSVYGAEARRTGWSNDSRDRKTAHRERLVG